MTDAKQAHKFSRSFNIQIKIKTKRGAVDPEAVCSALRDNWDDFQTQLNELADPEKDEIKTYFNELIDDDGELGDKMFNEDYDGPGNLGSALTDLGDDSQ